MMCPQHPKTKRDPVLLRCADCHEKKAPRVEVLAQSLRSERAIWPDLVPRGTIIGQAHSVCALEKATEDQKTAAVFRISLEDGKEALFTLPVSEVLRIAGELRRARIRFGDEP